MREKDMDKYSQTGPARHEFEWRNDRASGAAASNLVVSGTFAYKNVQMACNEPFASSAPYLSLSFGQT
jgi:hypothetical protein